MLELKFIFMAAARIRDVTGIHHHVARGVEAALILGITLAYLAKIGRAELRKTVYYALGTAFLASLGFAVLLSRTNWNQDIFEGWIMLAAAFFVGTMIVFMMRTAKHLKGDIEVKWGRWRPRVRP